MIVGKKKIGGKAYDVRFIALSDQDKTLLLNGLNSDNIAVKTKLYQRLGYAKYSAKLSDSDEGSDDKENIPPPSPPKKKKKTGVKR